MDAALADDELSPAEARERYRAIASEPAYDPSDQLSLDMADGTGKDSGEPPPAP